MILLYHKIHPDNPTDWWVTVNSFYRQMAEIQNRNVVYLDDYDHTNPKQVVITFDGIYKNVWEYALPILKHFNYPFELFVTSNYVGLDNKFDTVEPNAVFASKEELSDLVANGGRLQWHTKSHLNLKQVNNSDTIAEELTIPGDLLSLDKKGFKWFAYPYGEYNEMVVQEVKKRFTGAVSCNQGNEFDKYILNRLTVLNNTSLRKQKIACIVASYNYGEYLIDAVESVVRQTVLPDEILITDDASADETQLIAENYARKFPHLIRYNRNEKNLGIIEHFNKAVALTNADYVVILGADNRLASNYIEDCSKTLERDESTGIVYTNFVLFGNRAKITYLSYDESYKGNITNDILFQVNFPQFNTNKEMLAEIKERNFIHGSSMFKREAFNKAGGYKKADDPEDHHLFTKIIEAGYTAIKEPKTFLEYRQHSAEQANNIASLHQQINFYKSLSAEKNNFEKSRIYSFGYTLYKAKNMPFKKLLKAIYRRIFR